MGPSKKYIKLNTRYIKQARTPHSHSRFMDLSNLVRARTLETCLNQVMKALCLSEEQNDSDSQDVIDENLAIY